MEERFYYVDIGRATRYLTLTTKKDDSKSRENFYDLIKKGKIVFTEDRGKISGDLAIGAWVTIFFSEKFVDLLKKNRVMSFYSYLVKYESKYNNKMEYYYLIPTSHVKFIGDGTYLKKRERDKLQKNLDNWVKKKDKIYFKGHEVMKSFYNMSTWDGSDFFGVKDSGVIIVTGRLKKIIEKAKLKNIEFEELKEYKYDS